MSIFSNGERAYLEGHRLGRLATADARGRPHVVPVSFRLNAETETIDVGGYDLEATKKWRDIVANDAVAFVVDDVASVEPWRARGIEVRGRAELIGGDRAPSGRRLIRIHAQRIVAWGIEPGAPRRRTVARAAVR